jgi:hypothetical protein
MGSQSEKKQRLDAAVMANPSAAALLRCCLSLIGGIYSKI